MGVMQEPNRVWFGLGAGGGGQAAVYGRSVVEFSVFAVDDLSRRFLLTLAGSRWGPGLGGSGAAYLVVISSLKSRFDLIDKQFSSGWGFQLNLGGRWGDVFKALGRAPAIVKLLKVAAKVFQTRIGKALSPDGWKELSAAVTESLGSLGMNNTNPQPQLTAMQIPLVGGGLEVSLYNESFTVMSVDEF